MKITRTDPCVSAGSLRMHTLDRNGATYYATAWANGSVCCSQRYVKRNGTTGSRNVGSPSIRDEIAQAVLAWRPLRESICTPATIGEAAALLA